MLYGVDILTGEVAFRKPAFSPKPGSWRPRTFQSQHVYSLVRGPDGMVYTFMLRKLVRINPDDVRIEVVGDIGGGGEGDLAFVGRDLYLSGSQPIRRIRNIVRAGH